MRLGGTFSASGRALAASALALVALATGGWAGCSILLATDIPAECSTDADCAPYPNTECDNVRRLCVKSLPVGAGLPDSGLPSDGGGAAGSGGQTCQLSFDNQSRIQLRGPDGGMRPLPEGP